MNSKNQHEDFQLPIRTDYGRFTATYSAKGLSGLKFPGRTRANSHLASSSDQIPAQVLRWHRKASKALQQCVRGSKPTALPPLDLSGGTDFQRSVWSVMRKIGLGKTRSYSEVALAIGKPRALRAVGGACGANPIPVFVPCHRVLAANQKLGGFSGGLNWKRTLLQREGVQFKQ